MQLYQPRTPLTSAQREDLRDDGNFVGGIVIMVVTCLIFVFSTLILTLIRTGFLPSDALQYDDLGLGNTQYLLLYACVYTVSMGGPALLCCLLFRRSPRKYITARPVRISTGIAAVVVGMGVCVGANIVASMLSGFLREYGISQSSGPSFLEDTGTSLLLNLFVFALLPALLEELVFRVCVLGTLRKYGDWFAIIVSALLFGLIHGGISQSVFALIVGLILGYVTLSTGNVWLAVVIHFANNALSTLLQYFTLHMDEMEAGLVYSQVLYPLGILGIAVAIICAMCASPLYRRLSPMTCPAGKSLAVFWTSPLMLIGSVLVLLRMLESLIAAFI